MILQGTGDPTGHQGTVLLPPGYPPLGKGTICKAKGLDYTTPTPSNARVPALGDYLVNLTFVMLIIPDPKAWNGIIK